MLHAPITIKSHYKYVAQRAGCLKQFNVTRVQKVKASVGEYNALSVAFPSAKPQNELLECQHRGVQRVSMLVSSDSNANPRKTQFYHAAYGRRRL